jgi:hypothetical protein
LGGEEALAISCLDPTGGSGIDERWFVPVDAQLRKNKWHLRSADHHTCFSDKTTALGQQASVVSKPVEQQLENYSRKIVENLEGCKCSELLSMGLRKL